MHNAALMFIVLAVVLACWGFSVVLRSISEWRFFRKYPKASMRRVGRWWSPIVGLIAMVLSLAPLALAIWWMEADSGAAIGWAHAAAVGVGVVGVWSGTVWLIGDRARGRRRCARCLYDLSGLSDLRCPECGRLAKSERHLARPRRPRWAGVVSVAFLLASGFILTRASRVNEIGPLMIVPRPVLMAGWRWLPASTIYSWEGNSLNGSLEDRLRHIDELDWPTRIRIADRLMARMHRSESDRWNRRLTSLVNACLDYPNPEDLDPNIAIQIAALGRKHASLFDQIGVELAIAATTRPETEESIKRLEFPSGWPAMAKHPYVLMQRLAYATHEISTPDTEGIISRNLARRAILPNTRAVLTHQNAAIVLRDDPDGNELLFEAALDSGYISDHLHAILPSQPFQSSHAVSRTIFWLTSALATAPDESRSSMLNDMVQLVASTDPQQSVVVMLTSSRWARGTKTFGAMPESFRVDMLNALVEHGLHDGRVPFPTLDFLSDQPLRSWAQGSIMSLDPDGSIAMPLLREWVLDGDTSTHFDFWTKRRSELSTANWLNHLSDLATHRDRDVRLWISESLPLATGTPYDERVHAVITTLAEDPDEEIAGNARDALRYRNGPSDLP